MIYVMRRFFLSTLLSLLLMSCAYNGVFFPKDTRDANSLNIDVEYKTIASFDDVPINISIMKPAVTPKAIIFLLHGSGSTVNNWIHVIEDMIQLDYQIIMMEHRGFGKRSGNATHLNSVNDAEHVLAWLHKEHADSKMSSPPVLVMGQSYGAQIAIKVLNEKPELADGLVIEGAFTSFEDIAMHSTPLLVRPFTWATLSEPYNAQILIKSIKLPKLIIHSTDDRVVPFVMGQSMYRSAAEPKAFFQVDGGHITATSEHAVELDKQLQAIFKF